MCVCVGVWVGGGGGGGMIFGGINLFLGEQQGGITRNLEPKRGYH